MIFVIEKESQDITNQDDNRRAILDGKEHTLNDVLNKDHDLLEDADVELKKLDNEFIKRESWNSKIGNKDDINSLSAINMRKDKAFKNVFRTPKKHYLSLFKTHSKFFKTRSKSERKNIANYELDTFVQAYFIDKDHTKILEGLTKENLINLVGRIVIPEYMTKESSSYI